MPGYDPVLVAKLTPHELRSGAGYMDYRPKRPLVTFVLDDGNVRDYTVVFPKFQRYGWPATTALVTGDFNRDAMHTNKAQVDEMVGAGWEVASHTVTHPHLTGLTETKAEAELTQSLRTLQGYGYTVKNLVYPFDAHDATVRALARQHYRAAGAGYQTTAPQPLQTFAIPRYAIKSGLTDVDYKGQVDAAIANNEWVIFVIHSIDRPNFLNATQEAYLEALMAYVDSQGVQVVTLNRGLDLYGNVFDAGDYAGREDYAVVSGSGLVARPLKRSNGLGSLTSSSFAGDFPEGQITVYPVTSQNATGFPAGDSVPGVLIVDRAQNGISEGMTLQIFRDAGTSRTSQVYLRRWDVSASVWLPWRQFAYGLPKKQISLNFPIIPAGGEASLDVTVNGAAWGDVGLAQPGGALEAGLVIKSVVVGSKDTVTVTLANVSGAAINPVNQSWLIKVFQD